ncbi:DUF58 domain-containing protein [Clostridium bowmanii]|uniref:DUF58 domain-containing protein n=1 Tax=Clostridium bowmanii TaxID=132925 RepID=UPI001C0AFB24|nr:DUF58 domain-containing protein [Clostridium bowmanii]MBU3191094.1 DUF58 domain-containing protein [Clostridium bowmanii]MCA1075474.1 DUF58 domain-containing protein [Clostridium bowmanii]
MIRVNKKIIVLSIIVLIFAYISGGNLPYSIFYVFAVTIILGIIYMFISKKSLSAKLRYDSKSYNVGDSANITIIVGNSGIIPTPYVYVESKILGSLIEGYCGDFIFIGIDKSKWIVNKIFFKKRGIYDFGDIHLEVSDLFCIFTSIINIHNKLDIRVYPKIYDLFDIKLCGQDSYENLINSKSGIDDFTLIKDIRKYNTGDNLKKVHWKLSAKHGELYVKNFDSISGKECNLFMDMHIDNLQNGLSEIIEEDMVDFSLSLTKYMMNTKIKTTLFINAKEQKEMHVECKEDFLGVMELFLKTKSDGTLEFTSFIKSNLKHIAKGNWIGIVSISVDDTLRDLLINLKEMRYRVSVFYYAKSTHEFKNNNIVKNIDLHKNITLLKNLGIECINFKELIER